MNAGELVGCSELPSVVQRGTRFRSPQGPAIAVIDCGCFVMVEIPAVYGRSAISVNKSELARWPLECEGSSR